MGMTINGCERHTVVVFPLGRRTADIRRAAEQLTTRSMSEKAALTRWVQITDRLADELEAVGCEPYVIAGELCDFEDAVNAEIARHDRRHPGH